MGAVDVRTAIVLTTTVFSAGVVVGLVKSDIREIKRWMREHKKDDSEAFQSVRSELAELRGLLFNRPGV